MRCVGQVEIDPYCRRVLAKHWPDVRRFEDVRTVTAEDFKDEQIDVIAGGFPCQDVSNAGKRAGIDGERSGLWSEFYRLICEIRPRYILVENVSALLVRGMGRVLGDLAAGGLDAEWFSMPAGTLGAHHLRERTFIVAHSPDADGVRPQGIGASAEGPWSRQQFEGLLQAVAQISLPAGSSGGISDGVPSRMDRLKSLGNAVVPQVAEWIGRRIIEADERRLAATA